MHELHTTQAPTFNTHITHHDGLDNTVNILFTAQSEAWSLYHIA